MQSPTATFLQHIKEAKQRLNLPATGTYAAIQIRTFKDGNYYKMMMERMDMLFGCHRSLLRAWLKEQADGTSTGPLTVFFTSDKPNKLTKTFVQERLSRKGGVVIGRPDALTGAETDPAKFNEDRTTAAMDVKVVFNDGSYEATGKLGNRLFSQAMVDWYLMGDAGILIGGGTSFAASARAR